MKYTKLQIKEMAQIALEAKARDDFRWLTLLMAVSVKAGMSPNEAEQKIMQLADDEFDD